MICWTTITKGCEQCRSQNLEDFTEFNGYSLHKELVHALSCDLAVLGHEKQADFVTNCALRKVKFVFMKH